METASLHSTLVLNVLHDRHVSNVFQCLESKYKTQMSIQLKTSSNVAFIFTLTQSSATKATKIIKGTDGWNIYNV